MDAVAKSRQLGEFLSKENMTISVAESCTGGLLASAITDVAGSSNYFTLGLVTYSLDQKAQILGLDRETIEIDRAVSEESVLAMLDGLHKISKTDICLATSGYAGPTGGNSKNPAGTVYMGIMINGKAKVYKHIFDGSRSDVKNRAVYYMLSKLVADL